MLPKYCRKCNKQCWGTYCKKCTSRIGTKLTAAYARARYDIRKGVRITTGFTL